MKKSDVLEHFGGVVKTADALRISKSAVSKWPDTVPRGRAFEIEVLTRGLLRVDAGATEPPRTPTISASADSARNLGDAA
jgi:hypothetical protein